MIRRHATLVLLVVACTACGSDAAQRSDPPLESFDGDAIVAFTDPGGATAVVDRCGGLPGVKEARTERDTAEAYSSARFTFQSATPDQQRAFSRCVAELNPASVRTE
jgi:hypothetical protein